MITRSCEFICKGFGCFCENEESLENSKDSEYLIQWIKEELAVSYF